MGCPLKIPTSRFLYHTYKYVFIKEKFHFAAYKKANPLNGFASFFINMIFSGVFPLKDVGR
ncbi:hypothetical protein D068_cds31290 [Bacillus atrophaeus UCMB-5137]|nr:hypothetical protein D068_cds31290 [Bacillus atrophaeus UCMB-5137]